MKTFWGALLGLLGSGFGFAMFFIALFSIPLNVIAIMRLMEWEWWSALIAAVLVACIPIIGQITFLVLALLGAYYFISSGWSWQRAVYPTVDLMELSADQFAAYKTRTI